MSQRPGPLAGHGNWGAVTLSRGSVGNLNISDKTCLINSQTTGHSPREDLARRGPVGRRHRLCPHARPTIGSLQPRKSPAPKRTTHSKPGASFAIPTGARPAPPTQPLQPPYEDVAGGQRRKTERAGGAVGGDEAFDGEGARPSSTSTCGSKSASVAVGLA